MAIYIGIDMGTSGCRACAIDENRAVIATSSQSLPPAHRDGDAIEQDALIWWQAVEKLLTALCQQIDPQKIKAICVDGTSGTLLLTDGQGNPLSPALMYNDSRSIAQAEQIKKIAPEDSAAQGASSGLAKLIYLQQQFPDAKHALHQADWIAGKLSGQFSITDENNALKTGYNPIERKWPDWLNKLNFNNSLLPEVVPPGTVIGNITRNISKQFNMPAETQIIAGTTDSIAAFIATGTNHPGEAVTSLGSTLVLKIISAKPVFNSQYGIYSHRLGKHWLAGGASNSGGAVLKQFFTPQKIDEMTHLLNPEIETGLNFYPLTKKGERFPVNDSELQPRLQPRPRDDAVFFQAILEGISKIEYDGYTKLHELGAPFPVSIQTAGGGSCNPAWTIIRKKIMGTDIKTARQTEACYGAALLAMQVI
ncbi:MAG: FGGY-family carbohydrate kinase [Gammaproteobacteria bacterium]|nr:FGGY-family carbohydrate kinase [Gammaproteobacteria bacterium]MCW9004650.1 FGGY-family carbohydrate kinase [Gammaproteobacteria bacterium]